MKPYKGHLRRKADFLLLLLCSSRCTNSFQQKPESPFEVRDFDLSWWLRRLYCGKAIYPKKSFSLRFDSTNTVRGSSGFRLSVFGRDELRLQDFHLSYSKAKPYFYLEYKYLFFYSCKKNLISVFTIYFIPRNRFFFISFTKSHFFFKPSQRNFNFYSSKIHAIIPKCFDYAFQKN